MVLKLETHFEDVEKLCQTLCTTDVIPTDHARNTSFLFKIRSIAHLASTSAQTFENKSYKSQQVITDLFYKEIAKDHPGGATGVTKDEEE